MRALRYLNRSAVLEPALGSEDNCITRCEIVATRSTFKVVASKEQQDLDCVSPVKENLMARRIFLFSIGPIGGLPFVWQGGCGPAKHRTNPQNPE